MELKLERLNELAAPQDAALEALDVSATRRRLLSGEIRARKSLAWRPAAAIVVAAAAMLALWMMWPKPLELTAEGRPLEAGVWWVVPPAVSEELGFSDGTRFVLAGETRVQISEVTAAGARVVVGAGSVWAHVQPLAGAEWSVALGPYEIVVTGTVFTASWDPSQGSLAVELVEGGVTILGPTLGTGLSLQAGEHMRVASDGMLHLGKLPSDVADNAQPALSEAPATASATTPRPAASSVQPSASVDQSKESSVPTVPRWVLLAREQRFEEALTQAKAVGWGKLCRVSSAARLIMLADLARFGGDGASSRQALLSIRERFAGNDLAARAAFLLGRASFAGQSGDFGAVWFAAYLAESPKGALAAEAAGRLIQAHQGAGRTEQARAAAQSYLEHYATGPYAALARSLTEEKNP